MRRSEKVLRKVSKKSLKILQAGMSTRPQHLYEFGPYRLDTAEQLLLRDEEAVPLTPKAFETLVVLVERSGHLVEKDELMKLVWSDDFVEESRTAEVISRPSPNAGIGLRLLLKSYQPKHWWLKNAPSRVS